MGLNGSPTGELVLEDVVVPAANRLAAEGKGFTVAMRALDSGRIGISGQALGIAQAAVDQAARGAGALARARRVTISRSRKWRRGSSRRACSPIVRRGCARRTARSRSIASMAKLHCTDTAMEVALGALQLVGEEGTIAGSPFERHMRDAKALQIYEGSNQVQRVVISRDLVNAR